MDIVIDVQGFRNVDEKFIPKEVAINVIIGHCIMMSPFSLSKRVRRENNWLSRNYQAEWFDGETNHKYFTLQLHEIIRQARYMYQRAKKKKTYVTYVIYSPEMYII